MFDVTEMNILGWYPTDFINLTFRKKRAIRGMFIGESGRFVTRVLVPSKNAAKGEEVTWQNGTYAFNKETALLDTNGYLPFQIWQKGNPQPLPVNELSRNDWLRVFRELGGQTAAQYKKAFRAKLVEDLLYQADADVHARIKRLEIGVWITLGAVVILGFYTYQEFKGIQTLLEAVTNVPTGP